MFTFTDNSFIEAGVVILILIPSIIVHEVSHGFVANRLGDPTARNAGRLTLNPLPHIDPFGSLLLPGMLALAGAPIFGWAKPVPVQPGHFSNPTQHMAITALAGPASNVVLAAILARLVYPSLSGIPEEIVLWFIFLNLLLAVFNMLPIPPLDGSRLLPLVLPERGREIYQQFEQFGFLILFALLFLFDGSLDFMSDWAINLLDFLIV
ncbi:MAG: site-2 protease family protein [Acidimicrobiia bacterium]|nr:site-2 protease family protein [Acidimicrobiia bacterium]